MTIPNTTSLLLILAPHQDQEQTVEKFLQEQKLISSEQPLTNLSYINQEEETLKINTVRQLIANSAFGTYSNKKHLFVILHADKSSIPAQNALLKIVEEPPVNTQIILVVSEPSLLLPTIHSRCHKIFLDQVKTKKGQDSEDITFNTAVDTSTILQKICSNQLDYAQAIELAEQYQTREAGSQLVMSLMRSLHQQINTLSEQNNNLTQLSKIINHLFQCHLDLQKNLNVRLALEHCFFRIIHEY